MNLRRLFPMMLFLAPLCGLFAQEKGVLANILAQADLERTAVFSVGNTMPEKKTDSGFTTFATIINGDTIPVFYLKDVNVWGSSMLLTPKEIKSNAKLIRNVKVMLPYAREAKRRLDILEVEVANMSSKQRKAALKQAEKDIEKEYKKDLKRRTYSQGLVLIKLIDRETSRSAYTLVSDLRGSLRAGLYQACAWLFGYNLKSKFDPSKDSKDNLIDRIVKSIDRGQL